MEAGFIDESDPTQFLPAEALCPRLTQRAHRWIGSAPFGTLRAPFDWNA